MASSKPESLLSDSIHFERYFVERGAKDEVLGVKFLGADKAKPATGVLEAIRESELLIIYPSNSVASIITILTVKRVGDTVRTTDMKKWR